MSFQCLLSGVCCSSSRLLLVLATTLSLAFQPQVLCSRPLLPHLLLHPELCPNLCLCTHHLDSSWRNYLRGSHFFCGPSLTQKSPPLETLMFQELHVQVGGRQDEAEKSREEGVSAQNICYMRITGAWLPLEVSQARWMHMLALSCQ